MKNLLRIFVPLALFLGLLVAPLALAHGQQQPTAKPDSVTYSIYVDTAGVQRWPEGPNTFVTWIFAKQGDDYPPVSGIIVAFNCDEHMVRRLAQVVYGAPGAGPDHQPGQVEEVDGPWQTVTIPDVFDMVCKIGEALPPAGDNQPSLPDNDTEQPQTTQRVS